MVSNLRVAVVGDEAATTTTTTALTVDGLDYAIELVQVAESDLALQLQQGNGITFDSYLLFYDHHSAPSFDRLPSLIRAIQSSSSSDSSAHSAAASRTPFLLASIGHTKIDNALSDELAVRAEAADELAQSMGGSAVIAVSMDDVLQHLVRATTGSKEAASSASSPSPLADPSLLISIPSSSSSASSSSVGASSAPTSAAAAAPPTILDRSHHHLSTGPLVFEEPEEEEKSPFKRNPNLNMDRMKTQSRGGLGRDMDVKEEKGCCGSCMIA